MPLDRATNSALTRSSLFAPTESEVSQAPRRSLSRFVFDRLQSWGITASVESLRSPSRNFLLITVDSQVAASTNLMVDHGNTVGEALTREIRAAYGDGVNMYGIFWRVEPPPPGSSSPESVLQKARLELEMKIRERRAARNGRAG